MDLFLSLIIGLSLIMFSFYKKFMKIIIYFKVKGDILYEGTEKVPFGIKDLKNFFKTIF